MAAQLSDLPLWCVVQADGDRVHLTSRGSIPIQYWRTLESPASIQRSLHRALCIAKRQRIVATVADVHRSWWRDPLWCVPNRRRIVDESSGRPTVTLAAALSLIERAAGADALSYCSRPTLSVQVRTHSPPGYAGRYARSSGSQATS